MSTGKNEYGDNRRSLLGEFSAAHRKEFEIWKDRTFEESTQSQAQMRDHQLFEENNLEQKLIAEKEAIGHMSQNLPSYSLSYESTTYAKDRYEEIMANYEESKVQLDIKYSNIRDNIRDNSETLQEAFTDEAMPPVWEAEPETADLEQLGVIDYQSEFNISADITYQSTFTTYEDDRNPFTEDWESSHYEGDFIAPDNGNDNSSDNGNDGGGRRM